MKNDVLEYIGLDINKLSKIKENPIHFSGYNNPKTYKVYDYISVHDLEILITPLDRTAELKERYKMAKPLSEYLKTEDRKIHNIFLDVLDSASVSEIKKLEKLQEKFAQNLPYFIRYDKNYLWQIYYSEEDKKYFMLFPANEGETSVLFYIIKKKLEKEDTKIFVPISKKDYNEILLSSSEINDIENYIWLFTNEWPNIYEVCKEKLYITGKTKVKGIFETNYRNVYSTKESAKRLYTFLKALFILTTETNYKYTFTPTINDLGELELNYENKIVNLDNLSEFIDEQTEFKKIKEIELEQEIEKNEKKIKELKEYVKKQNEVYVMQEKQIAMFMQCKKSFFKKISYYFKSKKFVTPNIEEINIVDKCKDIEVETSGSYTIKELVNTTIKVTNIENKARDLRADIKSLELKKENLSRKIKNASEYIAEIEEHKKSIFEFWKFTNKDNILSLDVGDSIPNKIKLTFDMKQDLEIIGAKADAAQRQKLSINECEAVYIAKEYLEIINNIGEDNILEKNLNNLKKQMKNNSLDYLLDDYSKTKTLNNREHRESTREAIRILKINSATTLDEFKERLKYYKKLLSEAYNKITAITDLVVYIEKYNKKEEYVIGNIDPEKIFEKTDKDIEIHKINLKESSHLLYISNIVLFENNNQTLPLGMDTSTEVLLKNPKIENVKEENLKILVKDDEFNCHIRNIKIIE